MLTNSFMHGENTIDLWDVLTMLEAISKHTKRKGFCLRHGLIACTAVRENARESRDLADPAAIVLAFDLNREIAHWLHRTT